MHLVLRNINQWVKRLATRIPRLATRKELLVEHPHMPFRRTSTQQPYQPPKDVGFPNPSWSQEMMDQFEKFTKMSEDGSWQHLPNLENFMGTVPEGRWKENFQNRKHLFIKSIGERGMGFEYTMFLNRSEKRVVTISQMGPYLEGFPGIVHGGAIATILDQSFGASIIAVSRKAMIVKLNINCKSPVALGSVVLVDTKVEKIEGRKIFLSGEIRSADGQTLHVKATCLSIQLQPPSSPQKETDSSNSP